MSAIATVCPFCFKPRKRSRSWGSRLKEAWSWFTAGDRLLDASGNIIENSSGDSLISDGSGDSCCCNVCDQSGHTECPSSTASQRFQAVITSTNQATGCNNTWVSDPLGTCAGECWNFTDNNIDGTFCVSSSAANIWGGTANDQTFSEYGGSTDIFGDHFCNGTSCSGTNTRGLTIDLRRVSGGTWVAMVYWTSSFTDICKTINFYGEQGTTDCRSDFTVTNSITSYGYFTVPRTIGPYPGPGGSNHQPIAVGWGGQIHFVACGC